MNDQQKLNQIIEQANKGEKKKAYAELCKLQKKNPTDTNILLWMAFTAPDIATARQAVLDATRLNPGDASVRAAHRWLGDQERLQGVAPRPQSQAPVNPPQMRPGQFSAPQPQTNYAQGRPGQFSAPQPNSQWQGRPGQFSAPHPANNQPPAPGYWQGQRPPAQNGPNPFVVAAGAAAVGALAGYALGEVLNNDNDNNGGTQTRVYRGIAGKIMGVIVSIIAGLICLLVFGFVGVDSIVASLTFSRTEGTVIQHVTERDSNGSGTLYVTIVRYKDKKNQQYEGRWNYSSNRKIYAVNDKVQVLYEASTPRNFKLDNFEALWQVPLIWLGVALFFLLIMPLLCLFGNTTVTISSGSGRSSDGSASASWGDEDNGSSSTFWGDNDNNDNNDNGSSSNFWGGDNGGGLAGFFSGGNDENNSNGGSSSF